MRDIRPVLLRNFNKWETVSKLRETLRLTDPTSLLLSYWIPSPLNPSVRIIFDRICHFKHDLLFPISNLSLVKKQNICLNACFVVKIQLSPKRMRKMRDEFTDFTPWNTPLPLNWASEWVKKKEKLVQTVTWLSRTASLLPVIKLSNLFQSLQSSEKGTPRVET